MQSLQIDGGFAEPVLAAQVVFRALMDALARPGSTHLVPADAVPPAPLSVELAAIALALCDHDSPIWLAPSLHASETVRGWLSFHTGAPIVVDPAEAGFALVSHVAELPDLGRFAQGSDEYPDRSCTLAVAMDSLAGGAPLRLEGPGIKRAAKFSPVGLPPGFQQQWAENGTRFPRGVDLLLTAGGAVVGLPRTTRISPWSE